MYNMFPTASQAIRSQEEDHANGKNQWPAARRNGGVPTARGRPEARRKITPTAKTSGPQPGGRGEFQRHAGDQKPGGRSRQRQKPVARSQEEGGSSNGTRATISQEEDGIRWYTKTVNVDVNVNANVNM